MDDKLQLFYNSLTANPNIKGLPGDYDIFRTTLTDPAKSELFYNSLKANQNIKGLPDSYDEFVSGLALRSGGITPKEPEQTEQPEQQRPGFFEGLGKKFSSSIYGAGEGITEAPQFGEAVKQLAVKTMADAYINRLVKKGKITAEQAEAEKKRTDTYIPKIDFLGIPHKAGTELPGTKMADSKANKWLSETSDRLSKEGERYDKRVVDYLKAGQFGKALGAEVYSITESLAPTLLAAAGGPVGAGALGIMAGAETYDEVKDREDMQEAAKVIDGVGTMVFEALFEYFGTAEMTKVLKGIYAKNTKRQAEDIIKNTLGGLISKAYKRFGVWFASVHEGLSEGLTTLGQNLTAKFTGEDPDRKMFDNFIESILVGTGMGSLFAGTEKGLEALAKKFKGQENETDSPGGPIDQGPPGGPIDQGPPGIGELKVPYTEEQATEAINEIGRDLKFGDTPLEEDPNPIISFAETKLGQKVILKKEGGVNGDTFFIAFDLETNEPILVKPRDILERKDVPYQEWVKNELRNYNIVKAQGDKMVAQAEAPVQEGQEITLKDKNFYVSEVTPEGIALNEIDEEGNVTGATVHITPDQYGPVFGIEEQPGEAPTIKEGATGQPVTEEAQTAPQEELQIPLNKQGEIDYDNIQDPQTYAQALIQEFAEGAPTVLDELITEKQDALAKAGKVSNAIERARKVKSLNSEVNKLTDVRNILSPTATTTTIASPAVEQAEPIEQPTAQDMARPEEEEKEELTPASLSVVDETEAPSKGSGDNSQANIAPESKSVSSIQSKAIQQGITEDKDTKKLNVKEIEQDYDISADNIIDAEFDIKKGVGFSVGSYGFTTGYMGFGNTLIRIKDHTPEWAYFREDIEDRGVKRIINVTVGNYESKNFRGISKTPMEEMEEEFPDVEFINIEIEDGESVNSAIRQIKKAFDQGEQQPATEQSPEVELTKANAEVDTNPTEAQKKAGNYQKGHVVLQGMDITIENPAGSVRKGTDEDGKDWAIMLNHSYGYFKRTRGKDGDQIDVIIGDKPNSRNAFVIDQINPKTGAFDEHKVVIAVSSEAEAREVYLSNYEPGWKGLGAITKMTIPELKEWKGTGKRVNKPVAKSLQDKDPIRKPKVQSLNKLLDKDGIITAIERYNEMTTAQQQKNALLANDIQFNAQRLGFELIRDGRNFKLLKDGNPVKRDAYKTDKRVIEDQKLLTEYSEDFQQFVNDVLLTNPNLFGVMIRGLSNDQRAQAARDIAVGKKSVATLRTLDSLETMFNAGGVDIWDNVSKTTIGVSYEEIKAQRDDILARQGGDLLNNYSYLDADVLLAKGLITQQEYETIVDYAVSEFTEQSRLEKDFYAERFGDNKSSQEESERTQTTEKRTGEPTGEQPAGPEVSKPAYGESNTVFTKDAAEKATIKNWLSSSDDYSGFISFDWDGEVLEIFMGRDKKPIEIGKDELIEMGVELSEAKNDVPAEKETQPKDDIDRLNDLFAERPEKTGEEQARDIVREANTDGAPEKLLKGLTMPNEVMGFFKSLKKSESSRYTWSVYGKGFRPYNANKIREFFAHVHNRLNRSDAEVLKTLGFNTDLIEKTTADSITFKNGVYLNIQSGEYQGNRNHFFAGTQVSFQGYVEKQLMSLVDKGKLTLEQAQEIENESPNKIETGATGTYKDVQSYINSIRNPDKKKFAEDYNKWVQDGRPEGKEPIYGGKSAIAQQAVRWDINKFYENQEKQQPEPKQYKYKMSLRPFDIGTYPKEGFVKADNDPNGGFHILTYNRKLTEKERNHWSFLPLTEVDDIKGKNYEDKDGEFFVDLEWMPNYSGADVSMFDNKNQLVEKPFFMSTNEILKNIESGYWTEKHEWKGPEQTKPDKTTSAKGEAVNKEQKQKEQVEILKKYVSYQDQLSDAQSKVRELQSIKEPTKPQAQELARQKLLVRGLEEQSEKLVDKMDYAILDKGKSDKIQKLIREDIAQGKVIKNRIDRLKNERNTKERSLQNRNELSGDRKAIEDQKKGMQDMFAGESLFKPTSENLQSALKPFNDAIAKAEEELSRNEQLLNEKIDLVLKGAQKEITYEESKQQPQYGSQNKVFTADAAQKARELLRKKLGNLNVGIDPEVMQAGITLAGYHIEAGARKFADYAKEMINDMGEAIKPYLKSFYNAVRDWPGFDTEGMDDYAAVSTIDVSNLVAENLDNTKEVSNLHKNIQDVPNRSGDSQPNSQNNSDEVSGDEETVPNEGGSSRPVGDESSQQNRETRGGRSSQGGSGLFAPLFGEPSNNKVSQEDQSPEFTDDDAGDFDGRGNDLFGPAGHDSSVSNTGEKGSNISKGVSTSFQERTRLRKIAQQKAEPIPVKIADKGNIEETLPVLLPEQQEDVLKAENRFFNEAHQTHELAYGKGMLFTNGTGTGKTYTGLGIIKRFVKQGKRDILIVVPSEAKKKDWIKEGEGLLLSITELKDTKDKGNGVRVTTYATFRANENLKNVDFDLVVYDECHRLMEDKGGNPSATTEAHYQMSNVSPNSAFTRITSVHPLWIRRADLNKKIRIESKSTNNLDLMDWQLAEIRDKIKALEEELKTVEEEIRQVEPSIKERAEKAHDKTKVLMLSATPFKGHFNLRYANKVLFDWGDETTYEQAGRGMSRVDPEGRFFLDNFGAAYEWKYHRLQTKSNANAEAIAMQEVEFAEKLMKQGVLSGRAIESNMDYSREFPLVALDKAEIFNQGFTDIFTYGEAALFPNLTEPASEVFFNYNYTTQLLESLRASMSIPRIEKHLTLGRKVVVFHRRKQANASPPFANILQVARSNANTVLNSDTAREEEKAKAKETLVQADLFEEKYRELLEYEQTLNYSSAIDQIIQKFGAERVGLVNGDVSKKDKMNNIRRFNEDDSGVDIIVVQEEAGKEGISLHDTTGKHPRVMMSLSLPISSTTALQMEGRIFRIGQASNAIFENPILGLDMEIADFGQKINRKLSTTENLAVGNQARDLIRSFSEGVLFNAKKDDPHIDQGKGGKEYDKKAQQQLSEFRRAVLVYSTNQKNRGRRDSREGIDYFATPEPLGQKMVEWLDLKPGNSAMEPSAGHGAIAMWFPESINTTSIEPSYSLYAKLNARAGGGNRKIVRSNFEDFNIVNKFDGIAMNPPFGTQGKMAMDHIEKAFNHLRNRGRIVAIIPDSPSMQKRFDSFINGTNEDGKPLNPDAHLVESIKLPRVTFEQAGTQVAARVVVIDKIEIKTKAQIQNELAAEDLQRLLSQRGATLRPKEMLSAEALRRYEEQFEQIPHTINRELPEVKTVDEFFDRIEDISVPARPEAPESANSISTDSPTTTEPAQEGDVAKLIIQKHSKTGAELPTVQLLNRVSSDVYNKYKSIASSFGGRWSSYKREGMIPGFIFRNGEDAKNALTQINNTKNDVSSLHDKAEKYIKKNKVYSQARPKTDFPEEVSFVSEGSLGNIPGQLNLFGEEVYSPTPPDDNVTYVERLLSDKGQIEFIGDKITGPSEIRSSADIAFLFKNLESAASENVFFVFIDKNNKYKVLYMSTGTTNMAPVDTKIVVAAAKEFKAERAVFVHNHPSGSLKASDFDITTYSRTRDLLEKIGVTLDPSVIINLDSGEYAVFDTSSISVVPSDKMYYDLYETVTPQSIYQFDRQKLYTPLSDHHAIRQSSDVAEYLSRMKRGTTPKIHAIILDRNLKITRYALYDETITREKLIEELLYEVGKHGENIILASNSDPAPELLSSISNAMKLANGQLLDYVVIKQSDDITRNYNSYADLGYLSEPDIEYGGKPDAKFRISDDLYFSPVERALDAIKQDKATPQQWKAMFLKNGAKQAELDWMGWDEFANDKRVITKAKIQDWIDQNKIRVEEVQKGGFQWKGNDLIVGGKVVANLIHNEDGTWSYQSDFSEGEEAWETKLDAQKEAEEAIIGDAYSPNATKYSQYTLPEGENYKELLLTMPYRDVNTIEKISDNEYKIIRPNGQFFIIDGDYNKAEKASINDSESFSTSFKSAHFDEPNILAHVRFNTRRTQDGKNILFIEEIQSDWAQEGKKKGFKSDIAKSLIDPKKGEVVQTDWGFKLMLDGVQLSDIANYEITDSMNIGTDEEIKNELIRKASGYNASTIQRGIPDMPYKKTDQWAGLVLRRMVRYAIDNGFDAVAWTPGEVQNERYDLSKQLDNLRWIHENNGTYSLIGKKNGRQEFEKNVPANDLENWVGKEIAQRIIDDKSKIGELKGEGLKIGGSGMKGFYDNILPSIANKLGKKFGSQVTSENIATGEIPVSPEEASISNQSKYTYTSVHSLPITDAMFESYRQGIPLFRRNQYQGQSLLFDVVGINTSQNLEKEIRDKVKDLEESLNTKITIIQNRGQLPERIQRQAIRQGIATNKRITGVYDPQTESVYVLLDDVKAVGIIKGIQEVIKTVLHEVVAHKGLPSLLGQDEYNRLLDSVYWDMPQIDRSFLMEQYNTTDPHTIAEEYLAMMAEQNVSPTLFQRILAKIRQLLRKLFKINYSENDIHDMLRRSRENLHKPQANNYTNAEEYLEAIDTYEKARFRVAKAYSKNIVDKAAEAYKEKEVKRNIKETKQGIREYIQDLNLPVRKFEEEVLKRGGKQDDQSKPYRDTSLSFGRHEKLYNDFFDQKMKPVLNTVAKMKKTGIPGENILPYIIAKHAIERNRVFRTKERDEYIASNPEATPSEIKEIEEVLKDKDYSGVMPFDKEGEYTNPDELAQDIVNEFETQLNNKGLIDELWENLRTANTSILDTWVKGDQISEEQREEYLNNFKYFVPLRGWRQGAAKELIYTKGQGFSRSLRHAEGRKTLADNPLAYILSVQFQAISEQVTNEVNNSMLNLIIKNLGNNEIHELATLKKLYYLKVNLPDGSYEWEPTLTRPTAEQFASGEARTKIFREHEKLRAPSQAREHEVIVRKPGGDMVMIFKGQNLPVAQSLNKQNYLYRSIFGNVHDARDINKAMTLLGDINNVLKAAYTSWNVVFPFTNFMRDFQEASITQAIKQGSGLKVIRNYKHAFPAIIRHLTGKADLNNRIDKELEEFYQYGGATGYTHLKTPEEIEKDIKKEIKRMVRAGSLRGDMANTAVKFLGGVEAWNMIFEDATRFSVYLASIASGNTKKDAAYDAKEASVNFNRKGKGSKAWDAYFAFFNVAIQSMQKNFALAKDHTGKFAAVAGSFIAVGFLEAMMNALFDDDDDTSYYNINPYMRQNYLVIPNIISLLRGETKGDKYLSIPLPQFWRGFKSMGAIGFDIAVKKATVKDGIMQALGNFGASLLPVDIGGFWASGEFSFAPIMPTVIKPVVEVLENTNYMGYAIKNEPFTRDQEAILANAGLGKKNVSPAAKFITDMLFRWGGGDSKYKYYYDSNKGISKKVPGILDINPSTIEHLFKGYTGGTGGVFSDMITTISQALDVEQEIDYRNMPFINRFIRKIPESKWDIISKYYDLRDDNKVINALSSNYFKEGQYEKALEIAGDEYMEKYVAIFKHYESELNDAKKAVDFDDVEGNYVGIELMRQCVNDINDLKEEYGR